jgi:hypothetical protein
LCNAICAARRETAEELNGTMTYGVIIWVTLLSKKEDSKNVCKILSFVKEMEERQNGIFEKRNTK